MLGTQLVNSQVALNRQVSATKPWSASGPFTRVSFVIADGEVKIAVPRYHSLGVRGDSVYNLSDLSGSYNLR